MPAPTALGPYLEDWLDRRRSQIRPATHRSYRELIRRYVEPVLGQVDLAVLDRPMIERFYAGVFTSGGRDGGPLSPRTVQYIHAVLHRALEDAVLDGLLPVNPARTARPPRHHPAEQERDDELHVWTAEEAASFLTFVDDHRLRALWHLALGTGARRGEVLGLRWCDVDLDAPLVRIRRALTVTDGVPRLLGTKTSRPRTVAIGASVADALSRHREAQARSREEVVGWPDRWGLVFTDLLGGPLSPHRVSAEFRRLLRRAGLPRIRLHDLRHTHATLLLGAGVPMKVISDRLGHRTIAMTMDVYGHVLPAQDAAAGAALDAILRGASRGEHRQ